MQVKKVRREGVLIPTHFHAMPGKQGYLVMSEEFQPELRRHARVARLQNVSTLSPLPDVLPLVDAQLIHVSPYQLVLTGMERVSDGVKTVEFAQSWLVFPVSVQGPEDGLPLIR